MSVVNKIIFLDVDGVLNSNATFKGPWADGGNALDPDMCDEFARIVRETDATVILSSTWRFVDEYVDKLREWLLGRGVVIHDFTPDLSKRGWGSVHIRRETEIDIWLEGHKHDFPEPRFVIIDDYDEFSEEQKRFWVETDDKIGLTPALADKAIEILNG